MRARALLLQTFAVLEGAAPGRFERDLDGIAIVVCDSMRLGGARGNGEHDPVRTSVLGQIFFSLTSIY